MAVGGVGGLFGQLINPGLDMDIARQMTPNPNPLAQQGPGGVGPKSVDSLGNAVPNPSQQPPLAPGAFTQPDPVNASYNANLIKAAQRDAYGADLNRNIEGIAAGFGTAQQQASKQAALRDGGGVGGGLRDLATIQAMQEKTIGDNEHARFMANVTVLAQRMGVTPAEIIEMSNTEDGRKQIADVIGGNLTATGTTKDAEAATRAWAQANPNATPEQIAAHKANLIAGGMGGSDLNQREYLAAVDASTFKGTFSDWQAQHNAEAAAKVDQAKAAQDFKDTAVQDYTGVHSKLTEMQQYVDTLAKNPAAAQEALQMFSPTTGRWGAINPLASTEVKAAAIALQKVQAALKGDQLSGVKNVRNLQEFNVLGLAATGGLDAAASPEDFATAILNLQNKYLDAQATSELAVGHKLTGKLVGHGNRDLLEPTLNGRPNPYYNGGSEEAPGASDFSKMSAADADKAYEALPSGAVFTDTDGKQKKKP